MDDSTKIAQLEQFVECQLTINKKLIKIINRIQDKSRGSVAPHISTDEMKEVIEIQGEMIKWLKK